MDLRTLEPFTLDHHGLITRQAAARLGVSAATWYRAADRGLIEMLHRNVARVCGAPTTPHQRVAAAVLAASPGAMASHRTAAWLWGIPTAEPDVPDVLLTERGRRATLRGVAVHRPRDHRDLVPVLRSNIATTNVLRTLCDLGAHDPVAVPGAVGHVVTTRMARVETLHRAVIVHSRCGRPGVPALRQALEEWDLGRKPPDSVLEPAMQRLVRRHRLPPVDFHVRLGRYEVDFLVRGTPVVIECDGWAPHVLDRRTWERDKVRDAELAALGYLVVRVTYRHITERAAETAARIRAVLAQWSPDWAHSVSAGGRNRAQSGG